MSDSTPSAPVFKIGKHLKPSPKFPLTAHPSFRWCKKYRGKAHYFGPILPNADDYGAAAALAEFERRWPTIKEPPEREPEPGPEDWTLRDLGNDYLNSQRKRVEQGLISPRTFEDAEAACLLAFKQLGPDVRVVDLKPQDFEQLRGWMLSRWKGVRTNHMIGRIKGIFRWGQRNLKGLQLPHYADGFDKVPRRILRDEKRERGRKFYEAEEIRTLLDVADVHMRAAILLGVNAGLGNADVSRLRLDAIQDGWLTYPRPKTGINRRIPLWAETLAAIDEIPTVGRKPKAKADRGLIFLTRDGEPWEHNGRERVSVLLKTLEQRIDTKRRREARRLGQEPPEPFSRRFRGFYSLRHVFYTIAQRVDRDAAKAILGHAEDPNDIATAFYLEEAVPDERLQAAVQYVHDWLWPPSPADATEARKGGDA